MLCLSFMGHHCKGMSGKSSLLPKFWGLILYSPKAYAFEGHRSSFLNTFIIFTPKPELFDETPPI